MTISINLRNLFTILTLILYNFYGGSYQFNIKNFISTKEIFRRNVFLYKASNPILAEDLIYQISNNRIRFNMNLQSKIINLNTEEANELLYMLSKKTNLQADTVNIFIKHALDRNDIKTAARIFKYYFSSRLVIPSVRSLNIMMDAYRRSLLIQNLNSNINSTKIVSDNLVDNIYYYFQLFDSFQLQPDSYTYSCLIQISRNKSEILELLSKSNELINPPVLRCAIETLGKLNEPAAAFLVAISWASKVSEISLFNIFESYPTGDALLVSLFQNPTTRLTLLDENKHIHATYYSTDRDIFASTSLFVDISTSEFHYKDLVDRLDGLNSASAAIELMTYKMKLNNTTNIDYNNNANSSSNSYILKCSSKGYCALFTFLQREIRKLSLLADNEKVNVCNSDLVPIFSDTYNSKQHRYKESMVVSDIVDQLYDIRNCIWKRFKTEVVQSARGMKISPNTSTTTQQSYSKQVTITTYDRVNTPLLNGRLIDAILRTYLLDIDGARLLWKHQILPLLKLFQFHHQITSNSSFFTENYKESAMKGLEVLMFLSGRNMRQDIALEIANTVNARKFIFFNITVLNNSDRGITSVPTSDRRHSMNNYIHNNNNNNNNNNMSSYSQYCYSLYRSYCYGKKLYLESYQLKKTRDSFLMLPKVNEFLSQGLENSIQLQLGIVMSPSQLNYSHLKSNRIERIRIKF